MEPGESWSMKIKLHLSRYEASYDSSKRAVPTDAEALFSLLSSIDDIRATLPEREEHCLKLQSEADAKAEKRAKVKQLQMSSLKTWLDSICSELTLPYYVNWLATRADLMVQLPNKTVLCVQIPISKFQEILPTVPELIGSYVEMCKSSGVKVLIENPIAHMRW